MAQTLTQQSELTPVEAAARLRHLPGFVFFDSALENAESISLLAAKPVEIVSGCSDADWDRLAEKIRERQNANAVDSGIPRGFAAGAIDYDGSFWFGFYDDALVFRHADQSWSGSRDSAFGTLEALAFQNRESHAANPPSTIFSPRTSRENFCAMVRRAQEYIAAGDIYQVNLAHEFVAPWSGDAWKFYEALRHFSPAPHAVFLQNEKRCVLSSSPELFLRMSGRHIRTRPIKGTRPRHAEIDADQRSAFDLVTSPKEIAELVMITDLERNDLGRICEFGSVKVVELLKLEKYEQVFHLVSTVEGRLREEVDHVAALRACFPGGSITGAPKKRAREIIAELEPVPRGLYTGALGYFGFNGESQFNIAIRTLVIDRENSCASFHVGAGIVADSIPEMEYQETLDKAAGIFLAAQPLLRLGGNPTQA